jgi:CheY-specific phosphatase CheX
MSSLTLPKPPAPESDPQPIVAAVGVVAERSFYALVDVCDSDETAIEAPEWLVSTVYFDDGVVRGSLACSVPCRLAQALFDSFSGRDPASPLPRPDQLNDLVGEFSNMVCGDWLSRSLDDRVFELSPPVVARAGGPASRTGRRQWMTVNELPLAIDWQMGPIQPAASDKAGH